MLTVALVTVARSDFNYLEPVYRALTAVPSLTPTFLVSGTHLSPAHGQTVTLIEAAGYDIGARIPCTQPEDAPLDIARAMSIATTGFAEAFAAQRPAVLVLLGDRYETHAAAVAALPFQIPIVHLHGGEETEGAIDNVLRHSITKFSHWHGVATDTYRNRLLQMGEPPERVHVTGAPALDLILAIPESNPEQFQAKTGFPLPDDFLIATFHPETLNYTSSAAQVETVLDAALAPGLPVIWTMPNADTGGLEIRRVLQSRVPSAPHLLLVENLGAQLYYTALRRARAMIGNSSSGILEAPSFALPVVNVGDRQKGRIRAANVIDVPVEPEALRRALRQALDPAFKASLTGVPNPYGDGHSAPRIAALIQRAVSDPTTVKRFHDLP